MSKLFPEKAYQQAETNITSGEPGNVIRFGRSVVFDYETGEFSISPTGKFVQVDGEDSWIEWCKKAVRTRRYSSLIYSEDFGQEFNDVLGRGLTKEAIESEIKRMTTECLEVDPRTANVRNFNFGWEKDKVSFDFEVQSIRNVSGTVNGEVNFSS
ncbi:DUF2634 domain-containing protein [Halobacillus litoralis]|uniref:DUF2634 domain-containing protein n=1 Tax=Halobacillus litoralis TaxID=45668 RepID=A0A410MCE6_9BACI|nr:DUF2634 domain-containing protein [Halobacillus litoralis]QAS52370.1 hypothetical protein HLI_09060 [Halobacillus litoralis]